MTLSGQALRMTVLISHDDRFRHRPLHTEIVHRAHAAGLAGATVLRGCEGFGASSRRARAKPEVGLPPVFCGCILQ
jgi:PII-like signaling protein